MYRYISYPKIVIGIGRIVRIVNETVAAIVFLWQRRAEVRVDVLQQLTRIIYGLFAFALH